MEKARRGVSPSIRVDYYYFLWQLLSPRLVSTALAKDNGLIDRKC